MPDRQISIVPLTAIDLAAGQAIACYNEPEGGRVVFRDGHPYCSCGEPVVKLISASDPGPAVGCRSIQLHQLQSGSLPDYKPGYRPPLHA